MELPTRQRVLSSFLRSVAVDVFELEAIEPTRRSRLSAYREWHGAITDVLAIPCNESRLCAGTGVTRCAEIRRGLGCPVRRERKVPLEVDVAGLALWNDEASCLW